MSALQEGSAHALRSEAATAPTAAVGSFWRWRASPQPSVGLAFKAAGHGPGFVVYAENPLPANRRSRQESNSAFSDLKYVLYLGHSRRTSDALVTSEKQMPIKGRQAKDVVPFGAAAFTVVVSPKGSLGGAFFKSLPWIIGVAGGLMA